MDGRKYDLVVFGATGFTGQYTVDEVARVAEEEKLTWAVAGRNMQKLQKVLSEASSRIGKDLDDTAIIIADTSSPDSLLEMAKQARVVLNTVGPYRFYGEPVVKACIEGGAHHLDISGEPQFLEKMQLLYNSKAKENDVFVIGATGFDSIPAEMGIAYTCRQFKDGDVTNVESYLVVERGPEGGAVNLGTLESAIHGFAHMNELKPLRKSLYPEPMPKYEYKLPKRSLIFFNKDMGKWCLPFMGSDKSVVYRTMRDHLSSGKLEKPIEFIPYFCVPNLLAVFGFMIFGMIFAVLAKFSFGQSLLMKYPHIFTLGMFKKGGPTKKQIEGCSFSETFMACGFDKSDKDRAEKKPTRNIMTKVIGPEPGYVATPILMVQAGVTILKSKAKMNHKGGVLTPGAAFWDTDLIDRLQKHNFQFITISDSTSTTKTD